MINYTPQIRAAIQSIKCPVDGFTLDIIDFGPFLALRFYHDEVEYLNERERLRLAIYLENVRMCLQSYGINSTLDPVFRPGKDKSKVK